MTRRTDINLWEVLERRSFALGPFYMGAGVACAEAVSEGLSTGQTSVALAATAVTGGVWIKTRIRDGWRQSYALAVLGASTSWVLTVHELVPHVIDWKWAGVSLLSGTLLGGIPWWSSDVRRRKVRMEANLRDWPRLAARINHGQLSMSNVVGTAIGPKGKFTWPGGVYEVDDVLAAKSRIEGALGADAGTLRMTPDGLSTNSVQWQVVERDPHALPQEWPLPTHVGSAADPLVIGPRENGELATISRYVRGKGVRHMLIAGTTESGKSGLVNLVVADNVCSDDVYTVGMDFKGGVELGPWKDALGYTITKVEKAHAFLLAFAGPGGALETRGETLAKSGLRTWDTKIHGPIIDIVVDEARKLLGSAPQRVLDAFSDIANLGRALGVRFVLATQYPTLEAIGTSQIRQQIRHRFCFRMEDETGETYVVNGRIGAERISTDRPGTCYMQDGNLLEKTPLRVLWLSDDTVRAVVEARRGFTVELDASTEAAIITLFPEFAERERWVSEEEAEALAAVETSGNRNGNPGGNDGSANGNAGATSGNEAAGMTGNQDQAQGYDEGPDVTIADVIARRRDRMTAEERTEAERAQTEALAAVPGQRLSEDGAVSALLAALAEAGEEGLQAKDAFAAADRSSSWFYSKANVLADEGVLERTGGGRWRLVAEKRGELTDASTVQ